MLRAISYPTDTVREAAAVLARQPEVEADVALLADAVKRLRPAPGRDVRQDGLLTLPLSPPRPASCVTGGVVPTAR